MTNYEKTQLAMYIASYIQEELNRGTDPDMIDTWMIADAIEAHEGGAKDGQ